MTSRFTATATVPTGTVSGAAGRPLFSDIQRAFPGLAGSASNLMSDYFARHPSLAPPAATRQPPILPSPGPSPRC